jgi:ATP dependent DNA ligase domain
MLLRQIRGIPNRLRGFRRAQSRSHEHDARARIGAGGRSSESRGLAGPHWIVTPWFTDGEALWTVVEAQGLEGLVAKPLRSVYKPGERGWLKVKKRAYWKYQIEREAIFERATKAKARGRQQSQRSRASTSVR